MDEEDVVPRVGDPHLRVEGHPDPVGDLHAPRDADEKCDPVVRVGDADRIVTRAT